MTASNESNSSMEVVWLIRDARGINYKEVAFLMVVASRGVMTAKWDTAAEDMGMKKDMYYDARDSLIEKDLIVEGRRNNDTTVYRVNVEALRLLVPESHSDIQNEFSDIPNDLSLYQNDLSEIPETKVTKKVTTKRTKKVTHSASAPVDTSLKEGPTKSSLVTESPSPSLVVTPEPSLVEGKKDAHSEIENEFPKSLMDGIKQQVEAISEAEGWSGEMTTSVLSLALDPSFGTTTDSAGRRVHQAKSHIRYQGD